MAGSSKDRKLYRDLSEGRAARPTRSAPTKRAPWPSPLGPRRDQGPLETSARASRRTSRRRVTKPVHLRTKPRSKSTSTLRETGAQRSQERNASKKMPQVWPRTRSSWRDRRDRRLGGRRGRKRLLGDVTMPATGLFAVGGRLIRARPTSSTADQIRSSSLCSNSVPNHNARSDDDSRGRKGKQPLPQQTVPVTPQRLKEGV